MKTNTNQNFFENPEIADKENILFKLSDLDLDALLNEYGKDNNYGEYEDYEVYKNYSLSRESWIDFIEVKYKTGSSKDPSIKYFGVVVLQGYLCSLDEIVNHDNLYFEAYLEDLLKTSMLKSLKYDYMQIQQEQEQEQNSNDSNNDVEEKQEKEISENDITSNEEESEKILEYTTSENEKLEELPKEEDNSHIDTDGIINAKYLI